MCRRRAIKRKEVLDVLATHRSELQEMGIASLALCGSVARDEATDTSDVDLLVEFDRPVGLFHFARVRRRLSDILGSPVDLVTRKGLREEMREEILREAIYAT
jgi:predicted nucleotidyltransferase